MILVYNVGVQCWCVHSTVYNVANVPPVEADQAQSTESFWATALFQGPNTEQLSCQERTFRGRG